MKAKNYLIILIVFILNTTAVFAQLKTPFTPRLTGGNIKVKGDVLLIGNSIIKGKGLASPYNGTGNNNNQVGEYIDVDSDASTFSSSTAKLEINNSCKRIVFAGLYWASIYPNEVGTDGGKDFVGTPRLNDWNQVKFKLPNGTNLDLTASKTNPKEVIYDGYNYTDINNSFKDSPIICFKDITSDIAALADADGTYTLANLRATRGSRNGGCAAGWTLVVIYESPTLPSKFISIFDGYAGVQGSNQLNIPISGFKTLPAPFPVSAKIGVSALEGDLGISGDTFQFKAASKATFTNISDAVSPASNFFNSTNSNNGVQVTSGNPASKNLLGYDIKNVIIPNALNKVLPNNETAGDLKLTTSGDGYGAFVTTFAVDIIEPAILLTKEVKDNAGADASNTDVTLGQQLNYVIGFENQGNDNATGFTIKDILPINIKFNYPADIDLATLPSGVTHSYNAATRTIIFNIPDNLVKANLTPGPPFVHYSIKLKVKVVDTCNELSDACQNIIQNTAYATYKGSVNPTQITDDPSLSAFTACNLGTPQATNFLVGVKDCLFTKNAVLCGASSVITASNGYASYTWSGPFGFTATGQTVTVTQPGVYKVFGVGNKPCTDYNEEITVATFGGTTTNPVTAYADNKTSPVCPNNGVFLPKIFLCGASASREIDTGISGASSIVWETTTCAAPAALSTDCANESASCVWTSAGPNGAKFTADTAGQYRLTINYAGGCFNRYYFNVYKNLLNPNVNKTDIFCSTPGSISVGGVPAGYEYSLDGTNYQSSNVFPITTPNTYKVYIKQTGVASNPCIFEVKNISISKNDLTVTLNATQPACFGDKATILAVANNVRPQYRFDLYIKGTTTLVNTSGLLSSTNQFLFENVNPGDYDVKTVTITGAGTIECSNTQPISIIEPAKLTANAALTKALTCEDGEITVTPSGGTSPYYYSVNGGAYVTSEIITVPTAGTYTINVADKNNCVYPIPGLVVDAIPKPVWEVKGTDIKCYGDNSGQIIFNVSNTNGYTVTYSIDGGLTPYVSSNTFSNLIAGTTYSPKIKYSLNGVDCFDTKPDITLTQPFAALTASAGVSELAGCGPAGEGKIRITNPQGGVAPYEYNFNNPSNPSDWSTVNDAFKAPGTYTVYIKDANGCIYAMPNITIDPEPVAPTISVDSPVFNCNGSATSTVTVTNPGGVNYSYEYLRDGIPNTPATNNVFTNVPSGPHTITVNYKLQSVTTYSNLLFESFGYGDDTTSPGINTTFYCFERQVAATQCQNSIVIQDGDYSVTAKIVSPYGPWIQPGDHTPQTVPATPKGRCLVINLGDKIAKTDIIYQKVISDIIPNQPINFELYAKNLLKTGNTQINADLLVALVDASGTEISSFSTGDIPKTQLWEKYPKTPITLNPGANTTLRFIVRSIKSDTNGNDVAIDDIRVYQLPKACITKKDFPITIDSGKAFTAAITGHTEVSCNGLANGTITIAAQNFASGGFYYSLDGAPFVLRATSPLTISGLPAGGHSVRVQYDLSASPCLFTLPQSITAPALLTLTASVRKLATCATGATITAVGGGGTPAYYYELRAADGVAVIRAFQTNAQFLDVAAGSYTVFVKDANLCVIADGVAVPVDAAPAVTATLNASSNLCYTAATGATLIVTANGIGTLTYSLDGLAAQNSNTFTNVGVGTHSIVVTDSNNCTATINNIVIAPELKALASITKELTCDAPKDATIKVDITGGNAPFTYKVKTVTGSYGAVSPSIAGPSPTSFSYTAVTADIYTFEITDNIGCKTTATATVNAISNPTATNNQTDPSCFNGTNGQIQIIPAGGSGGYTYSFDGNTTFSSPSLNSGLSAGAHTYQVKDSKGCVSPIYPVTLNNPTQVVASATIPVNSTCSTTTLITSAGAGGTGTYTYSFKGSSTYTAINTLTVTNTVAPQTITFSVKDGKGCIDTNTIDIPAYNPPTGITFSGMNVITCLSTGTTTSITLTPVAGVSPFNFEITAPAASVGSVSGASSGTFTNLAPGTYTFKVTDANGCSVSASQTIAPAAIIAVSGVKTDEKCNGANDGTATFTVTGASASGNYTYTITPGTVPAAQITKSGDVVTVTGLGAGTYTLVVKDVTTECDSNTASVTITAATAINFTLDATKTSCNNKLSTISFPTLSGGTPGYTYAYAASLSTVPSTVYGSTTTVDTAVLTSNIDVYVKDNNGCIQKNTIVVGAETAPVINTPATQCYTGTAISVTITGSATGTTTYSIDGTSYVSTATFNLNPGSYTLYLKDGFGCIASTPYVVAQQLAIATAVVPDATCTPNTTINLTATGGTGVHTFAVSSDGGVTYTTTTSPYVTAIAGTYRFRVTDSATPACTAVSADVIVVTKATVLTLTTTQTDVKCKGDATGSIVITPTSGKAPYTYSTTKRTAPFTNYTTNNPSGLVAGIYDIIITDALGCTSASTAVTIAEPAIALSATAAYTPTTTCSTTATVTVTGHDGTGLYTYSFNGGAFTSTNTLVVNDNGTDQVIAYQVKDANGCITVSQNITVFKLNPPTDLTFTPSGAITCSATTTTITLGSTGGAGILQYETIAPSPIIRAKQTSNSFTGLTAGTYLFKVTDANGCTYTKSYKVDPVIPINITGQTISNVLCNSGNTGIARYTVTGFSATGNYAVVVTPVTAYTTVGDVITLSNLTAGTYNVKVTDNTTGCTKDTDVLISEPAVALSLSLASNVNANCNIATSKVTVTPAGGTPGFTYAYMQDLVAPVAADYIASNVANLDPLTNANWDVWVKDANGCTFKLDVAIAKDPSPTVTAVVTNQCTSNGSSYTITATGTGGVGTLTYSIGGGFQSSPVFTVSTAGTYTVTLKDANNCTGTTTVEVFNVMTATAVLTKDLDCTVTPDATITINATGGKPGYTYQVSSDGGTTYSTTGLVGNVFTTAVAGTFQFEVKDSNIPACPKVTNSVTVNPIVYPFITGITQTNIKCFGDNTGVITVAIDATKGIGPFTYNINGGTYQSSNTFTGLIAGSYTVTVKDSKGCIYTEPTTIVITQNAAIIVAHHEVPITCGAGGISKGSVIIDSVTGGVGPYNYFVTSANGYSASENNAIGNTSVTFDVVDFGLYEIKVVDVNGCSVLIQDLLVASPPDDLDITVTSPPSDCSTGGSAVVSLNSGTFTGSGPFFFAIYTGPGMVYSPLPAGVWLPEDAGFPKQATFTNLIPGVKYTFIVYDQPPPSGTGTGCYYYEAATIPVPTNSTLTTSNVVPKNITCTGSTDGKVSFDITNSYGVATPITYQLYDSFTIAPIGAAVSITIPTGTTTISNFGALPVGNYFVLIKEDVGAINAGCSQVTANFSITQSAFILSVTASIVNNENCNNLGIINAVAKDGTGPYTFMISTSATLPAANDPAWASTSSFSVAAGSYYVFVKDSYDCIQSSTVVNLVKDPTPVIALTVADVCALEGAFSVDVDLPTAGMSPYTISVNGSAPQNVASFPYTISGLSSGLQTVVVTDVNGCSDTKTVTLIKKLSVNAVLTKELDCTVSPDAIVTLTVTDGLFTSADVLSDFTYEVSTDNGVTYGAIVPFAVDTRTATYTATAAGTYKFRITDLNGCTVLSTVVTIDAKVDPAATHTFTNPSCPTILDGTLTITATLGVTPYEYSIDAGGTWQSSNTFTGLGAGPVTYIVRDAKQCTFTDTETLVDPVLLAATPAVTDFACNASNIPQPAIVTVNVTAGTGTGPYKYNFDGSTTYLDSNTFVVGNLAGQTVNYSVKDFNGCIFNGSVDVNPYQAITDITFAGTDPTCPVPTSDVTLTVVGGYTPIAKYEIVSPVAFDNGTSNTFNLLAPDTYLFKVTDANGCSFEKSYTVVPVTPIAIVGVLVNDISCNVANGTTNNGSAQYTVTGFSSTLNYAVVVTPAVLPAQISNVGDVITLTGLSAGTYNVAVTDNTTGCTENADVIIVLPDPIAFTPVASKVFCSKEDSQITVSAVTGGTGVYTYAVLITGSVAVPTYTNSNVLTLDTNNFADLSWDVYVKDANGCVAVQTVAVPYETAPTFAGPIPTQCFVGSPLTVDLSTAGYFTVPAGVASYTVNGSDIVGSIATLNAATTYTFGVRDVNGCEITTSYVVNPQVQITATLDNDLTCLVDATISFVATNGSGVYTTYEVSYNGAPYIAAVTPDTYALAGTYKFRVTDNQGCQAESNEIIVTPKTVPTFTTTQVNVSCNGGNDGSILVTPADGIAPYTFALSGPVVNTTGDASGAYTGLIAGSYTIVVTDAKGCTSLAAAAIDITEPSILTASATPSINTTCSVATVITVVGAGGTPLATLPGYYYNFNGIGYTTTDTFTVNDNGAIQIITYTVKDANGCETAPQTVTINPLNKPTDMDISGTVLYCAPLANTTSTVSINTTTGGVLPLLFETIAPSPIVVGQQVSNSFSGLIAGDYTFKVTDKNGCSYQELYTVQPLKNIAVTGQLVADMTCNTGNDGKVTFDVSIFTGTYDYSIAKDGFAFVANTTSFANTIPLTGLAFGVYKIDVTDNTTLCTSTATITVAQPTAVTVTEVSNVNANCKTGALVQVAGAGGTPDYTYTYVVSGAGLVGAIFTTSDSAVLDPATSLIWDFYAKDANGCTSAPVLVTIVTDPLPGGITAVIPSQCPSVTGTYDFTINVATGMAPYEYSIGSGFQPSAIFTVNAPGTYDVTVKDKFGCPTTVLALVTILPALTLQAEITALPSCVDGDGTVTLVASGGSNNPANYVYNIDGLGFVSGNVFNTVSSGTHTFGVRDNDPTSTTCTKFVTVNLVAATPITGFAVSRTAVTCNGGSDGTITATMATPAATPAPGINNNPVYSYSLAGVPLVGAAFNRPAQPSDQFAGLPAGSYTITVTSGRGCQDSKSIVIEEPAVITVPAPTVTQYGCTTGNATNFATITVTGVTGGSSTYANYEFIKSGIVVYFGPSDTYTESDLLGGTYTVNVYDDKGCVGTTSAVINAFVGIDKATVAVTRAITCTNDEEISVTVTVTGSPAPVLDYKVEDVVGAVVGTVYSRSNNNGVFSGVDALPIGNYFITVTNPATGCSTQTTHYVNNPNTFELKASNVVDLKCFADTDGSATITFTDRVISATDLDQAGIFDYTVKDAMGATIDAGTSTGVTANITGLKSGVYTVDAILVDSPYCTVSTSFTINGPTEVLDITETHTQITCISGNNDGSISVTATGGWPGGYEYQLIKDGTPVGPYSDVTEYTGLTAGGYTINVKDSKGCVDPVNVPLANPTLITFTTTTGPLLVSCYGDTSEIITVGTPTGGSGDYLYTLITTLADGTVTSNGPQAANTFPNLGAGSYQVKVSDSWTCSTVSAPIKIDEPTVVKASLVVATTQTCLTQSTLTLTATGGTAPYTYSVDAAFTSPSAPFNPSVLISVPVGTYRYYVKDANDCVSYVSNDIKIDPLPTLVINLDVRNAVVNCTDGLTGVIVATAQGGLGNYVYTLFKSGVDITTTATQTTPGNFTKLAAGFYEVEVTSGVDCGPVRSTMIEIKEPATALTAVPTTVNVSCAGEGNGKIIVTAAGGTGIIKYAISPNLNQFFDVNIFENLKPDLYDLIAQDENGCYVYMTGVEIFEPNSLSVVTVPGSVADEICFGDKDGAFDIDISEGTAPYSVSLDDVNGTYTTGTSTQTIFSFSGLVGGEHTVYIKDANDCTIEWLVTMAPSVKLAPVATVEYGCFNNAASNTVTVTVDASITDPADVDYALVLDGIAPSPLVYKMSPVFSDVPPGNHFIRARHSNGCEKDSNYFQIDVVQPLAVSIADGGLNEIVATATGGSGGYQYTFNGESTGGSNTYIYYRSGDYTVTVTDVYGCVASATRPFEFIDIKIPNVFTPNGDGSNETWTPTNTENYKDLSFYVYDRYGRKLGTFRQGQSWDGKYNGNELPSGDYWYVLKLKNEKDAREFVGHFTLYR